MNRRRHAGILDHQRDRCFDNRAAEGVASYGLGRRVAHFGFEPGSLSVHQKDQRRRGVANIASQLGQVVIGRHIGGFHDLERKKFADPVRFALRVAG